MELSQTYFQYELVEKKSKLKGILLGLVSFILLVCIVVVCNCRVAYGDTILDTMGKGINALITAPMVSAINVCFYNMCNSLNTKNIDTSFLTADGGTLFKSADLYNFMSNISNVVIKPISGTILSIVAMMQMIKIASKSDSGGTIPVIKDVFFLIVFISIFCYVISHAFDICGTIYQAVAGICRQITNVAGGGINNPTQDFIHIDNGSHPDEELANVDVGSLLLMMIAFLFCSLIAWASSIMATVMMVARGVQLYIYATFSPIPMSLLGFDETKSGGVNYFRNFGAVALGGAILLIIIFLMPHLMSAIFGSTDPSQSIQISEFVRNADGVLPDTSRAYGAGAKALACAIVFIMGILKSGQGAKEIMGS